MYNLPFKIAIMIESKLIFLKSTNLYLLFTPTLLKIMHHTIVFNIFSLKFTH